MMEENGLPRARRARRVEWWRMPLLRPLSPSATADYGGQAGGFYISRLFLNAKPDELFRYFSKSYAFSFDLNAA